MKSKYIFFAVSLLAAMSANAQETYENAKLTGEDLNGTARYVGMGGAMEALGADISTIGTNPAGLGLFRHSNISISGGLLIQANGREFANGNKTNPSFDQIGGVYTTRTGQKSFLNFGFNYHKGKNFDYILNASGALNGSSQNKQSYLKGALGNEGDGGFNVRPNPKANNENIGYVNATSNDPAYTWSQADYLYWNTLIPDVNQGGRAYAYDGQSYDFNRAQTGYISNYDFSVSGNINDRVYLGLTLGLKDVHYKAYSEYVEMWTGDLGGVRYTNDQKITGSGFDVTAGVIVRPVAESPFRVGAYVKPPTWYDLTTENYTSINYSLKPGAGGTYSQGKIGNTYNYKIWTPWKFGFSLGHTFGNYLALGASYEYEDYSRINSRINDGGYYDYYYDEYYDSSSPDKKMNSHTKKALKGVSTLKLGIEYKPVSNLALRAGYNYVNAAYGNEAQKGTTVPSLGTSYTSTTDYTNWKAINRFTLGLGYQIQKFNIDLAYQYSAQEGDFYPFSSMKNIPVPTTDAATGKTTNVLVSNVATGTKIKNNRSQLLLTLGYRF